MFKIGSHVAMKAPKMLAGSAEEAHSYEANSMMIFTGAPQNTRRKDTSEMNIPEGETLIKEYEINDIIGHAPYIVNLGNTKKSESFQFGIDFMRGEVERCDALGIQALSFHPGAHVGAGSDAAISQIAKGLNEVLTKEQNVTIAIETMAGKGTEVGITFEQIAQIIEKIELKDKVSVTFDTCHTFDAGYDIKNNFDGVLEEFDQIVGVDKISVVHLNDSKNPMGSHKDRHENIGFGEIGFDALNYVAHHEKLADVPKILETPYVASEEDKKKTISPYKDEIAMLRTEKFNPAMQEDLRNQIN